MNDQYVPGVCNIGPDETARRRRVGEVGAAVTVGLAALLVLTRAPRPWRLLLALPATASALGFLQAAQRFCAYFGWRGVFNFGRPGAGHTVDEAAARADDRRRAIRLALQSMGIGLAVALLSLPRRRGC